MKKNAYFQGDVDAVDLGTSPSPSPKSDSLLTRRNVFLGALLLAGVALIIVVIVCFALFWPSYNVFVLPASGVNRMLVVQSSDDTYPDGQPRVIARSYNGLAWEYVADNDINTRRPPLICSGTSCSLDARGSYTIREIDIPEELKEGSTARATGGVTIEGKTARLLLQGTFGFAKAELAAAVSAYGGNVTRWIQDQINVSPTLLRTYYRERTSPRWPVATSVGAPRDHCKVGSRWHRYAFTMLDEDQNITVSASASKFEIRIGSDLRAEVSSFLGNAFPGANLTLPMSRKICEVDEIMNEVTLSNASNICDRDTNVVWENPDIEFSSVDSTKTQVVSVAQAQMTPIQGRAGVVILSALMVAWQNRIVAGEAFLRFNNSYFRYDPRIRLLQNSRSSPADVNVSGAVQCPATAKTFVNAATCVRRSSCNPPVFGGASVPLTNATLNAWFTKSLRYVYFITGLRLEDPFYESPCEPGRSRWQRMGATCPGGATTGIEATTLATLQAALSTSTDSNVLIRDINLSGNNCTDTLNRTKGAKIMAGGECFQHVHPNLFDVRDASEWTRIHDGNPSAIANGRVNPIERWARQGLAHIEFPWHHQMSRWKLREKKLPIVGRYMDTIDFRALATELQTPAMAEYLNAVAVPSTGGFEVCGSPGEANNDGLLGHRYNQEDEANSARSRGLDWEYSLNEGKSMVWQNVVLSAPDQLRQRVSWALSQIFTMSSEGFGKDREIEAWTAYYDIFVRNAFGNYRDILREVSYSPMMADYLSYRGNAAFAYRGNFPDENYAREIMQLFTVGLWKLNEDGTQMVGADGNPIDTYGIPDIVSFARLWTGFDRQLKRGNIEAPRGSDNQNFIDPLQIKPTLRDRLPKTKLDDGYIGDQYPLCINLPAQHWLKPGARFVFSGDTSIEGPDIDAGVGDMGRRPRFEPSRADSALYQKLCAPDGSGRCTFPSEVVLSETIVCHGQECDAGRVQTVKITGIDNVTKYFTYVHVPCVSLAFHGSDAKRVIHGRNRMQCAEPRAAVAGAVCCEIANPTWTESAFGPECLFVLEAMPWAKAKSRCEAQGMTMCSQDYAGGASWSSTCAQEEFQWVDASCALQLEVYPSGLVGVVDPNSTIYNVVAESSLNSFGVRWNDGVYPKAPDCGPSCVVADAVGGASCLCSYTRNDTAVFTELEFLPSVTVMRSRLSIGAVAPLKAGGYTQCSSNECLAHTDLKIWVKTGSTLLAMDTVFELPSELFLLNMESQISVDGKGFRNAPTFMPLAGEMIFTWRSWFSDAIYLDRAEQETEALLDHLVQHNNTAPFVCMRLIQRLVTSNPSPRYVSSCVKAFKTSVLGNLEAAIFAIFTDPEARSPLLEADPSFGVLREPILKVIHFMKALEYRSREGREMQLPNLIDKIQQDAFRAPSVFGYYLAENRPAGPITNAGLVSPEAQIGTAPSIVSFLNGLTSLVDNGLTSCDRGFGYWKHPNNGRQCRTPNLNADGELSHVSAVGATAEQVIDELSMLLTAGRLNTTLRQYFLQEYNAEVAAKTPVDAMKLALKMFLSAAEFHMSNANILSDSLRQSQQSAIVSKNRPFKAIVVVFLGGGFDSFNLVVPHSNCGRDYYEEYSQVRQGAAIAKEDLLRISASGQPCGTFGMHPSLSEIKNMYDAGEAAVLANIGALVEPVTRAEYRKEAGETRRQLPPSLFAHNVMQRSLHTVHAQNFAAKGVLARTINALLEDSTGAYKSELFSLVGNIKTLEGSKQGVDIISANEGVVPFEQVDELGHRIGNMTTNISSSFFGETFSALIDASLQRTALLGEQLEQTTLTATFEDDGFSKQLRQAAKLIKMRTTLNSERAVFVTSRGGFDTHNTFDLAPMLDDINAGIKSFRAEMKAQEIWDDVTILTVSDFARTLTSNGAGTDHAWGGNHLLMGGKVKGGVFRGQFPLGLTEDAAMNIGRGRVIPTSSWEHVWNGIVSWFGVDADKMADVLPNADKFPDRWTSDDLYR